MDQAVGCGEGGDARRPSLRDLWLMGRWPMYVDEKLQKTHKEANG